MLDVVLEVGAKKTFASVVDWPGWSRSGRDGDAALEAIVAYGPRYRAAMGRMRGLPAPRSIEELGVVERLPGDSGTDYGAPSVAPSADAEPIAGRELDRLVRCLEQARAAFDETAQRLEGVTLRTGPRGGGRNVERMRAHVLEAEIAYAQMLGARIPKATGSIDEQLEAVRAAFLEALLGRIDGTVPDRGPRGGARWSPRYAIRRSAWHALDHAWELEDRAQ